MFCANSYEGDNGGGDNGDDNGDDGNLAKMM